MRCMVIYESMFGNTHAIADEIAAGLSEIGDVQVSPTGAASAVDLAEADLIVVGGPTHLHGMSSKKTRLAAVDTAAEDPTLELDDDVGGPGLREWFKDLPNGDGRFGVAFDTRIDKAEFISGSAARGIARRLRHHGYQELLEHESFVLDGNGPVSEFEAERARHWGQLLASQCRVLNIQ